MICGSIFGVGRFGSDTADLSKQEKEFQGMEAMICSMTFQERRNPHLLNASRRKRIANGSGRSLVEVNQLLKQFGMMRKMMKSKSKMKGMMQQLGSMGDMGDMMGGGKGGPKMPF